MTPLQLRALFIEDWCRFHPHLHPLAWQLRQSNALPWVRFHALDGAKRYAENDDERREIFLRANALAGSLFKDGARCWLVSGGVHESSTLEELPSVLEFPDETDRALVWRIRVVSASWLPRAFDELITRIAGDEEHDTLWMDRVTGAIFAPYDGGFDLFPTTESEVQTLKARFARWLSPHPNGL